MEGCRRGAARIAGAARPKPTPVRPAAVTQAVAMWLVVATALACVPRVCAAHAAQEASAVRTVTSSNWSLVLEGEWMLKFHAPWCPACQQIQAEWESFGQTSRALGIKVGKVDVTQEPGLSGRFFVTTLPTFFHIKDGVFRRYYGSRMVDELHAFISEQKWKLVEPVAGWKSPSSILMSGMAGLFHLSGWIRQIHTYFTGPLGIPAWGSYAIFIIATLLIGLILGLVLVLLVDCFCPYKTKYVAARTANEEHLEGPSEKAKDSSEEDVEPSDNEADCEGNNEAGKSNGAKDLEENSPVEDSGTEEEEEEEKEEEIVIAVPQDSTPESESTLRQRRTEAVVDSEQ
ncbi:thioredoxin-related transmembrane protein 4 isoform X2 [Spea bombifrons]|uniref:thioredoxin-related transmembrane protein 4 isoform X2 n=1 Tax=Spea bombifrons TaxID=233779 RepID=UPI00234A7309|nr:thioredoxin-related transmembrane protein 4 isoform X2 [Spea bombifrons]